MSVRVLVGAFVVAAITAPSPAWATTVGGSLTYAGLPVTETFENLQSAVIQVWDVDAGVATDYALEPGDAYELPVELDPGEYAFWVLLSPRGSLPVLVHTSGDVYAASGTVQVPDQASFTLDFEMHYAVYLTQPVDSTVVWPGNGCTCPYGAPQATVFPLAWEPVPRAVRYEVQVLRYDCEGMLASEVHEPTGLIHDIIQGTAEGEQCISVDVLAYDDQDRSLAVSPAIDYSDGCSMYGMFFTLASDGRQVHSPGHTLAQVARVPGFGQSFWTTDLTLTNPTASTVVAPLYFTPRGSNGLTDCLEAEVTLPPYSCRTYADIVGTLFATTGAGALEVASPSLIAASRTATPASGGGSYGQGMTPVFDDQILDCAGDQAIGGGVMRGSAARTNVALNEVWGESADVRVELLDRDGSVLGEATYSLPPYGNHQINDVVSELGGPSSMQEGQVRVTFTAGTGRIAATLFLVDGSNDPSTVPLIARN